MSISDQITQADALEKAAALVAELQTALDGIPFPGDKTDPPLSREEWSRAACRRRGNAQLNKKLLALSLGAIARSVAIIPDRSVQPDESPRDASIAIDA